MKQYFANYQEWEDYQNGMYVSCIPKGEEDLITTAILFLSDTCMFYQTCKQLINKWPLATKVNLTNKSCNRKAWLGHAAVCFKHNIPEIITRIAWGRLSHEKQYQANCIALKIINHFEKTYERQDQQICF